MNESPDDDPVLLRKEVDRLQIERFRHLETKLDELEAWIRDELKGIDDRFGTEWHEQRQILNLMTHNVQRIIDKQSRSEPSLDALEKIIHSGMVMRWIILFVVTALAAIGTAATAWDVVKGFLKIDGA